MSSSTPLPAFVSRGGDKLSAALDHFGIDVTGLVCADLGSHVGGFVDCLLRRGAARVDSVDTAYGTLAWRLRRDPRVAVHERTNAMHVTLLEPVDLVTIDVGWTTQAKILPNAATLLREGGIVVTLIKPHYEAPKELLVDGVLPEFALDDVLAAVRAGIESLGWSVRDTMTSPIRGHGGNREVFALLARL
ncbi:MAG: SAM-dependent methyltransferase [Phycisphaerales bacterium]|nr:SAM-dependent methyltransferase [Phycisphaerales bacterium]